MNRFNFQNDSFYIDPEDDNLNLPLGVNVELENLHSLLERRVFKTLSGQTKALELQGPFYYLGAGGEKLVVSALCPQLREFVPSGQTERIAVAFAIDKHPLTVTQGWDTARRLELPTYEWILPSVGEEIVLMPDVSEGKPVRGDKTREVFLEYEDKIAEDLRTIVAKASQNPGAKILSDSYFLDRRKPTPRVILGDLCRSSPAYTASHSAIELQRLRTFNKAVIQWFSESKIIF